MKKITRIWHGMTNTEHAREYLKDIKEIGVTDYTDNKGNLSVKILRRGR